MREKQVAKYVETHESGSFAESAQSLRPCQKLLFEHATLMREESPDMENENAGKASAGADRASASCRRVLACAAANDKSVIHCRTFCHWPRCESAVEDTISLYQIGSNYCPRRGVRSVLVLGARVFSDIRSP